MTNSSLAIKKTSYIILTIILNTSIVYSCRIWGVVELFNNSITNNDNTYQIIQSESIFFKSLGNNYPNGWSLSCYNVNAELSGVYRSELTADIDSMYQFIFDSLSHLPDTTTKLIGHLRIASSGATGIPNPHPFIYNYNNKNYSLIHNGTLNKEILLDLITENGSDSTWIYNNPPHTYNEFPWYSDSGWVNVIDSELYLLWIMKNITENTESELISLMNALQQLETVSQTSTKNIIFSDGEHMYAYRSENSDNPNLFYSNMDSFTYQDTLYTPTFLSIISQIPTIEPASLLNWTPFNNESLLFVDNVGNYEMFENFINHPPTITLDSYADTIGVDYVKEVFYTIQDIDFDSISVFLINNPEWVTINDTSIIIIPEEDGIFTFSVYVGDGELSSYVNYTITAVNYKSEIITIDDVPDDDGGWVYVNFEKSYYDNNNNNNTEIYHIERKTSGNWISVGSSAAYGLDTYSVQVMTMQDSSSDSTNYTVFRVIASMEEGVWFSNPDSGYSMNNNSLSNDQNLYELPKYYSLKQNYPNPFNSATTIHYELPQNSSVKITVYDILGSYVIDIVDRYHQKGMFKTTWNGNDKNNIKVSSGVYYYIITAGNFIQKRKMTLLK